MWISFNSLIKSVKKIAVSFSNREFFPKLRLYFINKLLQIDFIEICLWLSGSLATYDKTNRRWIQHVWKINIRAT